MRVGVLGGTFDPVHLGHLIVAEDARLRLGLDKVIFMTAGQPWLKKEQPLTPAEQRFDMVRLATAPNPHFEAARQEIDRTGPTYTVDTLESLRRELGLDATIYFIVGLDALEQFDQWKDPERVLTLCQLLVLDRPGEEDFDWPGFYDRVPDAEGRVQVVPASAVEVSATELRRRLSTGEPLDGQAPVAVADYIQEHGLYLK